METLAVTEKPPPASVGGVCEEGRPFFSALQTVKV